MPQSLGCPIVFETLKKNAMVNSVEGKSAVKQIQEGACITGLGEERKFTTLNAD